MRLLGITDLHSSHTALERILAAAGPVDVILLGGDLTNFGSPADAEKMVRQAQATGSTVLAVAGNCDSADIEQRLVELGVSLMGRGRVLAVAGKGVHQGVGVHGLSAMPPWRCDMYQMTEKELADALQAGYTQIAGAEHHVVLSHPPPRDSAIDRTSLGKHVGSTAVRAFLDQTHPVLVICGHIHEARGVEKLGPTTAVNCGPAAAGYYALAEVGNELNVELRRT